ncbi:MAG: hypothetical protein ACXQS4_01640 [Methermicoccaceae archaeon]
MAWTITGKAKTEDKRVIVVSATDEDGNTVSVRFNTRRKASTLKKLIDAAFEELYAEQAELEALKAAVESL